MVRSVMSNFRLIRAGMEVCPLEVTLVFNLILQDAGVLLAL